MQVFYMFIKIGFCLSRNLHYNNQPEEAQDYDQESLLQMSYRKNKFFNNSKSRVQVTNGVNISPVVLLRIEVPSRDAFLRQTTLQCGVPSFIYQGVTSAYHTKHLYSKNIGYALRVFILQPHLPNEMRITSYLW